MFPMTRSRRLWVVLGLNVALFIVLIVVGAAAHSLGVWAEGADTLADFTAIGIALLAIWLSERPATPSRPDGHPRATAIAALINSGWLLVLAVFVAVASLIRLASGTPEVHGLAVLVVSGITAVAMFVGALILGGCHDGDGDEAGGGIAVQSVFLDTAADAATAAGVAMTGIVILATGGFFWLDPAVALAISTVISYHAVRHVARVGKGLRK